MGVDVGGISVVGEEVAGGAVKREVAARGGDGRLPSGEAAVSVGVTAVEEVQAARKINRTQLFVTAVIITVFRHCLSGFIV